jgi:hypothetical protein
MYFVNIRTCAMISILQLHYFAMTCILWWRVFYNYSTYGQISHLILPHLFYETKIRNLAKHFLKWFCFRWETFLGWIWNISDPRWIWNCTKRFLKVYMWCHLIGRLPKFMCQSKRQIWHDDSIMILLALGRWNIVMTTQVSHVRHL